MAAHHFTKLANAHAFAARMRKRGYIASVYKVHEGRFTWAVSVTT